MLEAELYKQLRDFPLDLGVRVKPGEILALMGDNGAGKSTVLHLIAGLLVPDSGSVRLNDREIFSSATGTNIPAETRNIGYVLQNSAVFPHLSVSENIAYGLKARHMKKNRIAEKVGWWMKVMDIRDLERVKAGNLSGGQKQRVALARALVIGPGLLMLDEPFTALDADSIASVKNLVRSFVTELNIPCIVVTHNLKDSHDIADTICVVCRGKTQWQGAPGLLPEGSLCSI